MYIYISLSIYVYIYIYTYRTAASPWMSWRAPRPALPIDSGGGGGIYT